MAGIDINKHDDPSKTIYTNSTALTSTPVRHVARTSNGGPRPTQVEVTSTSVKVLKNEADPGAPIPNAFSFTGLTLPVIVVVPNGTGYDVIKVS